MLEELALGGLLFSPLIVFAPVAFLLAIVTRLILHKLNLHQKIWKVAWFEVSLFVCYLALVVYLFGR
ncbi:DUF1656 domain-containing protein [Celerinatantimonas sp. YJH-8]|uniref:DUF1656 domain-containing protein n=1 Tax=Celerinatantimonas sp. YJH-8 TaxID=3228714 RepID=UPI0038CBD327